MIVIPPDSILPDSPLSSYTSEIPLYLQNRKIQQGLRSNEQDKEDPQQLPPHLEKVILNSQQQVGGDVSSLVVPSHVSLNHVNKRWSYVSCRYKEKVCLFLDVV
jgi:hypothetical protein